jgi:hypothetical protein
LQLGPLKKVFRSQADLESQRRKSLAADVKADTHRYLARAEDAHRTSVDDLGATHDFKIKIMGGRFRPIEGGA